MAPDKQRLLDFLGEQALAAGFGQRPVLDHVAGGADDLDLDPLRVEAAGRWRGGLHLARLHQRQRRAARADAQDGAVGRGLCHRTFKCYAAFTLSRAWEGGGGHSHIIHRWSSSASRQPATRRPPPWSGGPATARGRILSNVVLSQISEHAQFGGVVPEIAARAHVEALDHIIAKAMAEAQSRLRRARRRRRGGRARA